MNEQARRRRKTSREELQRLRQQVNRLEQKLSREPTVQFIRRLVEETHRSERYEHSFSLMLVRSDEATPHEVYQSLRPQLRSTDIVSVIPLPRRQNEDVDEQPEEKTSGPGEVAAILPETDRAGALAAVGRLKQDLRYGRVPVFCLATYPVDGDDPYALLRKADEAA